MVFLDKTKMLSEFWKRRVDPYEPQGGHSTPRSKDDTYPMPRSRRKWDALKSILIWGAAVVGVVALVAAIVVLPGLIF